MLRHARQSRLAAILLAALAALLAAPSAAQTVDYTHVLRMQIAVSFDGERIEFDELVFCGARQKSTLTTRPVTQVLPSRLFAARPTKDGGLLGFKISWVVCSLGQEVWRPGKTAETAFRAPAAYLPVFLWVDAVAPEDRRTGEYYASETALTPPGGRLRILGPMRFSVPEHPPSQALLSEAFAQEDRDNALLQDPVVYPKGYLIPVPKEQWSDVAALERRYREQQARGKAFDPGERDPRRLAAFLGALPRDPRFRFIPRGGEWLYGSIMSSMPGWYPSLSYDLDDGIPQRGVEKFGLLRRYDESEIRWLDAIIPLACDPGGVARADPGRRGVLIMHKPPLCNFPPEATLLEIDGVRFPYPPLRDGNVVFDTETGTLYIISLL